MVSATAGIRQTGSVSDRLYGQPCRDTRHSAFKAFGGAALRFTGGKSRRINGRDRDRINRWGILVNKQDADVYNRTATDKTEKVGSGYHLKGM